MDQIDEIDKTLNINNSSIYDYALLGNKKHWLSHPVLGDPSFDACVRKKDNPICRGTEGLEWPVNGFLFEDPISKNWFVYVGHYPRNYAFGKDNKPSICTIYRSQDKGNSWEALGPIFSTEPFYFQGDSEAVTGAPDVSVVYADGKYHMTYDWLLEGTTWQTTRSYRTGVGYAWSDKPEGPFHRHFEPIVRGDVPAQAPILGKYDRFYATTLIRRKSDWMILILTDSGRRYAWGLLAMTAQHPAGPYGPVTALFHVEGETYQPPLMEYFPAFIHDGWVYSPSTSVALNRDFQMIQRAKIEETMNPKAWEMFQHGSVWHGENREHEAEGMWGQTFSAFIDSENQMQIMFPSKDAHDCGTINMASRPWNQPYRESGFHLSGHQGATLGLLKKSFQVFQLECLLEISGNVMLFWNNKAILGPNAPQSNATIHSLSWPHGNALRIEDNTWQILQVSGEKQINILASGNFQNTTKLRVRLEQNQNNEVELKINNKFLWKGTIKEACSGTIGLLADKKSYIKVERFNISGKAQPATLSFLYTEGLLGAGQGLIGWQEIQSPQFRYQIGALCENENGRIKWNFEGTGFVLWQPKGAEFGKIEVFVDGNSYGIFDLYHDSSVPSQAILKITDLENSFHAVVLKSISGKLVVDCLDVIV